MSLPSRKSRLTRLTVMALAIGTPLLVPPAASTEAPGHCSATTTQAYLDCMASRASTSNNVTRADRVDDCSAVNARTGGIARRVIGH
jgi:hypothetical protein